MTIINPTRKEIQSYKKELDTLTRSAYKYVLKPFEYKVQAFKLLDDGVTRNIITQDYCNEKKLQFAKTLNSPSRAKQWIKEKMIKMKKKLLKKNKRTPDEEKELKDIIIMEEINIKENDIQEVK